ncbi:MAG TPA: hypothetical protein DDW17_06425 [Deltaproteobacteria bacterium]|nr:hypothetical protein [Deltaproteobacteria bacterium]
MSAPVQEKIFLSLEMQEKFFGMKLTATTHIKFTLQQVKFQRFASTEQESLAKASFVLLLFPNRICIWMMYFV